VLSRSDLSKAYDMYHNLPIDACPRPTTGGGARRRARADGDPAASAP
jgi:hypothetical protein